MQTSPTSGWSIANLDSDNDLEIVFYGFSSSGDVFAINHNEPQLEGFKSIVSLSCSSLSEQIVLDYS